MFKCIAARFEIPWTFVDEYNSPVLYDSCFAQSPKSIQKTILTDKIASMPNDTFANTSNTSNTSNVSNTSNEADVSNASQTPDCIDKSLPFRLEADKSAFKPSIELPEYPYLAYKMPYRCAICGIGFELEYAIPTQDNKFIHYICAKRHQIPNLKSILKSSPRYQNPYSYHKKQVRFVDFVGFADCSRLEAGSFAARSKSSI